MDQEDLEQEIKTITRGLLNHIDIFYISVEDRIKLEDKNFLLSTCEAFSSVFRELKYIIEAHTNQKQMRSLCFEIELFVEFIREYLDDFHKKAKISAEAKHVILEQVRDEHDESFGDNWRQELCD